MAKISENSIVEKSRFLLGMKAPNYELGELKILDTYLARINARDPKTKAVTFTKEEYESLMGLIDSRPETLKKRTEGLLGKVVTIPLEDGKKGWTKLTLFTKAECIQDDYGGYVVNLKCNPDLEPVFFNIEEVGYLRYRLRNILPLTSKYSMLLYLYLKDNMFRSPFAIPLSELRSTLGANQKSYEGFKEFRRRVLDPAIAEINSVTDICSSYERQTRGRLTTGLVFTVAGRTVALPPVEPVEEPEQMTMVDPSERYKDDTLAFYAEACNYEFSEEEMELLATIVRDRVGDLSKTLNENQRDRYSFFQKAYASLNAAAARPGGVKSRFAYIKTTLSKMSVE